MQTNWISIKNKIPTNGNDVLVCTISKKGTRNIDKGYWTNGRFIHRGTAEVTHWMPLPDYPEEEEK